MGTYYCIVNHDKKELIKPKYFGELSKFQEFVPGKGRVLVALAVLLYDRWKGDRVSILPFREVDDLSYKNVSRIVSQDPVFKDSVATFDKMFDSLDALIKSEAAKFEKEIDDSETATVLKEHCGTDKEIKPGDLVCRNEKGDIAAVNIEDVKVVSIPAKWFKYEHLPENLQKISKRFAELAIFIDTTMIAGREKDKALDRLLESKDAAVRAYIETKESKTSEVVEEINKQSKKDPYTILVRKPGKE